MRKQSSVYKQISGSDSKMWLTALHMVWYNNPVVLEIIFYYTFLSSTLINTNKGN